MTVDVREGSEFQEYDGFTVEYRDASHRYWIHQDGERKPVPSVTSVLKVLDKPALLEWAQRTSMEGALILERLGELAGVAPKDAWQVVRARGMDSEAKRDKRATSGTAIHAALERYVTDGEIPDLLDYGEEDRGYVQALAKFLISGRPEVASSERIVAHPTFGYAGRIDFTGTVDLTNLIPDPFVAGRWSSLVDLKTNRLGKVYPEAHVQTAGYRLCLYHCGSSPPPWTLIVGLGGNGEFTVVPCKAQGSDFLAVLDCYKAMQRLKAACRK